MKKTYRERIRELREGAEPKVTQREIANALNITSRMYQRYEYGLSEMPAKHVAALARFYRTSADYILGLTDERKPYPRA